MAKRNLSKSLLRMDNSKYIAERDKLGDANRLWVHKAENMFWCGGMFENEDAFVALGEWDVNDAADLFCNYEPSEYMITVSMENSWNYLVYYVKGDQYKMVREINYPWHEDLSKTSKIFLYTDESFRETLFLTKQENDNLLPMYDIEGA